MLEQFLLERYSGNSCARVKVRGFVQRICKRHIELKLADHDFESNLCSAVGRNNRRALRRMSVL